MRSITLAITFTNFGPYHLARLRALANRLADEGGRLIAYEVAGTEQRYPWRTSRGAEPFDWVTFWPGQALEGLSASRCAAAQREALERDRPDAVAVVGYSRPESLESLRWCRRNRLPSVLMSESGRLDHTRVWWKEAIKSQRVRRCSSALVGGPRHRDYLVDLGMPRDRIAMGYNAVDNEHFARLAKLARESGESPAATPYFLVVSRFAPEKNIVALIRAFAAYRRAFAGAAPWDLVLCGDGPDRSLVDAAASQSGVGHAIHRPGFLQADELTRWYAFASAVVLPSTSEPWGLVVNEAAACGVPLLVSNRAGCAETLVPDPPNAPGRKFEPRDDDAIAGALAWMADRTPAEREKMGRRAREIVDQWGPGQFASGALVALDFAFETERRRAWGRNHPFHRATRLAREGMR
jgi:1,2-diacylglycerol 3-alpha-glucosyltransferase